MNNCNRVFVEKNNIDFTKFDRKVYLKNDINWIISSYEVQGDTIEYNVCIEDLVGIDNASGISKLRFPEILDEFFDELGDGYHSRSISMLEYDDKTVIDKLMYSFSSEPIKTLELDNNKHIIATNGMHRFLILRLLYLNAKSKCSSIDEVSELKKIFTIPVRSTKVDLTKTYCKFLINQFQRASIMGHLFESIDKFYDPYNEDIKYKAVRFMGYNNTENIYLTEEQYMDYCASVTSLSADYTTDYKYSGLSCMKTYGGKKIILDDEQLIEYTRNVILSSKKFDKVVNDNVDYYGFRNAYYTYESFRDFIQKYFGDIFDFKREDEIVDDNIRRL